MLRRREDGATPRRAGARDPRLGRDVAIKVLPQHLSTDPNALSRFEREARAVAALSHPNILAIFDVGSADGVSYAVTELLEGETLRDRLKQGALPWPMASEIGSAIAEGVAAAHSKGIIHRDLKPENIFLTRDGRAKVLDFGLARWTSEDPDATSAPTETEPGVVMGTVGYMSPEQVKGKAAGAPSDVFSLGCVLYEMIAGRRAFARETAAQTMAAILEQPPPPLVGIAGAPKDADRLIAHCLEKDPAHRMQSAHDLAFALTTLSSGSGLYRAGRAPSQRRAIALAAVAAVALAISGAAAVYWSTVRDGSAESIAILPFVNTSGNADVDYLSDGITESLINRDLKPANVKVMPDGKVKVLDFGLAKMFEAEPVSTVLSHSPTVVGGTMQGVILGTAAYMSPEQARGQAVDKRTDIWAFGCVLFEMLTGCRAFQGSSATDIIASIIKTDPEWNLLPGTVSSRTRSLLRHCLQKDPKRRLHEIADARFELDEILTEQLATSPATVSTPVKRSRRRGALTAAAAAIVAVAGAALAMFYRGAPRVEDQRAFEFQVDPPDGAMFSIGTIPGAIAVPYPALSPDGRYLAFVAISDDRTQRLWVRALDSHLAQPVPGSENAAVPFWSPDSRYIGFFAGRKLKTVPVSGGPPQTLCDVLDDPRTM